MSATRIICGGCGFPQAWCRCIPDESITLRDEVKFLRDLLEDVQQKGHGSYHARGYSLATIIKDTLKNEN